MEHNKFPGNEKETHLQQHHFGVPAIRFFFQDSGGISVKKRINQSLHLLVLIYSEIHHEHF